MKVRVGDTVQGIQGVDGGKEGVVISIGAPYSNGSHSPSVYVRDAEGNEWDTYQFNVRVVHANSSVR